LIRLSRRDFIQVAGATATGLILPGVAQSQIAEAAFNSLKIPELLSSASSNSADAFARQFDLNVQEGVTEFLPSLSTPTFGINGSYLGPTLQLKTGEEVAIKVNNTLSQPTTLHWHGLHVPAAADGGPHQVIEPGKSWTANFKVTETAGTYWYHSHLLGNTGEQVLKGLAGMIVIENDANTNLGIPSEYGVDDIPLMVQDRQFNEDGSFSYITSHRDIMMGYSGSTILVNGTVSPVFTPTTEKVRFRLANCSNARTYNFAFSDNRNFQQISCDGGFLQKPVEMNVLQLAPAERCEIVVDFSDRAPVNLISKPMPDDSPNASQGMMRRMSQMNSQLFDILAVRPQSSLLRSDALASQLAASPDLNEDNIDRVRQFTLGMTMGMGMGMRRGPGGGGGATQMGMGDEEFSINGKSMNMNVINETVPIGSKEVWEVFNDTPMMHPFHVHHGQFQILGRNNRTVDAHEQAFKDTVKIGPGETVRFLMKFENYADPETAYMYHCHILEHEDNGMMGQFLVV
jgi:FtsP/CotA-like multicopper oxidase with cupredoxin domain